MSFVEIPFSAMQRHAAGAVRRGVPLESLLANSLIDLRHGDDRDVIDPVQCVLLCLNTTITLEDATHGLGRTGLPARYSVIGLMVALGCADLEGAIQAIGRLYAASSSAVRVQLRTEHEVAVLSVHMDAADTADVAYLEENFLVWMFIQCLRFLGRAPPIFEVTLRDPFHFSIGRPHWGVHGRVRHGDVTSFRFPRRFLAEPPAAPAGENPMWETLELWFAYMGGGAQPAAPAGFVNEFGFVRFSELARSSGKSPNTLRRQFQASNGRFRDARQQALADAAAWRLRASEASVETIAVGLGYSDARSFRRFLKNATGLTPQQIRDRRPDEDAGADLRAIRAVRDLSRKLSL